MCKYEIEVEDPYVTTLEIYSTFNSCSTPFSSRGFRMSNVHKMDEMSRNKEFSAKYLPGHNLLISCQHSRTKFSSMLLYLLPNPKLYDNGSKGLCSSDPKNRSGLNSSGSWYVSGSWSNFLAI